MGAARTQSGSRFLVLPQARSIGASCYTRRIENLHRSLGDLIEGKAASKLRDDSPLDAGDCPRDFLVGRLGNRELVAF
jgi:hypothetical protein